MPPTDIAPAIAAVVFFMCTAAVLIFRGPLGRAIARRIEGRSPEDSALNGRLQELEHRLAGLEQERHRMAELEERVDFAERLLATPEKQRELR